MLNQTAATKLRVGVYIFDYDGCQYPDRTMCYEPLDTRLFANNARVNRSIMNPVFIDIKETRARTEGRQYVSKIQGGYPVARLVGTTDIPRYRELTPPPKSTMPSTRDGPSDTSLAERPATANRRFSAQQESTLRVPVLNTTQPRVSVKSMPECVSKIQQVRSVLITVPNQMPDQRIIIDDQYYSAKTSVFDRLGSVKLVGRQDENRGLCKRGIVEVPRPSKRRTIDASDVTLSNSSIRLQSSIKFIRFL